MHDQVAFVYIQNIEFFHLFNILSRKPFLYFAEPTLHLPAVGTVDLVNGAKLLYLKIFKSRTT